MRVFLGLDAGGTRTRAALIDGEGHFLGQGEGGCALPRVVGHERAVFAIGQAVEAAWRAADHASREFDGVGAGFAGAGDDATRTQVRALCAEVLRLRPAARVLVDHDLGIAYRGAFGLEHGVVVVAGTGSAAFARAADGTEVRVGGFGPYADDAGSGFDLGRRALSIALRSLDGRVGSTGLVEACVRGLGLGDEADLVDFLRRGVLLRSAVAGLAPRICGLAREGDRLATGLLEQAADELALQAATVARRATRPRAEVACMGGLFSDATFVDTFRRGLAARDASLTSRRPSLVAELGAAWWAAVDGTPSELAEKRFRTLSASARLTL